MDNLALSLIIALVVLIIYTNYLFIDSVFFKGRAGFAKRKIQALFILLLTVVFMRSSITPVSLVVFISLVIIYYFRVSRKSFERLPKETLVKHSTAPYYYLALYWQHFLKPSAALFLIAFPALALIYIFSLV